MHDLEQILKDHGDAVFSFLLQCSRSDADARDAFSFGLHWQAPVPIDTYAATGPSIPLMPDPDALQQLALQRATRIEALRPSPPSLPFDLDRPRNSQPQTNRLA